jgi:hypothetical protein
MDLEHMIKLAEDQARRVLIGTREELTPLWLVQSQGKLEVIATPWADSEQKSMTVELMRALMREQSATAYSLLTEAWYSVLPAAEVGPEYTGPPPSERADRKEAVIAMAASRDGTHIYRHWEIVRDFQGRTRELRRLDGPEDRISSGIFDNLLMDDRGRAN